MYIRIQRKLMLFFIIRNIYLFPRHPILLVVPLVVSLVIMLVIPLVVVKLVVLLIVLLDII